MKLRSVFLAATVFSALASSASAAVVWNESVNGNLSNSYMAPTPISVAAGDNIVQGSLPVFNGNLWRDYFRFTVPSGLALVSIKVVAASNANGNNSGSIIGIAAGTAFTDEPSNTATSGLLGFTSFGPPKVGRDILGEIAAGNSTYNLPGFANPVTSGTYSVWVQDYDNPATYSLALRFEPKTPPTIKVSSKKVSGTRATLRVKASGTGTKVTYQVGSGAFKRARKSGSSWIIAASGLKKGSNTITIRAKGLFGTRTKKQNITVP